MGIRIGRRGEADGSAVAPADRAERVRWLVPPRLRTVGEEEERHASWLELFFDLVFVVAVTMLSHELVLDHSFGGFLRFAALFVPVYVAWQGYSFYADRYDTDDLIFRVTYFAAMASIADMAVLIGDVWHGINSTGFAVAYIVLRSLMLGLYWRAWHFVPEARPLIRFYATGYSVAVAIWVVSLTVEPPLRYWLWGIALTLDLSLPPLSTRLHQRIPTSSSHVPERWGLFTLIVLGESVAAVALETVGADWRVSSATAALLGFAAVAAVWWVYFDRQVPALRGSTMSVVIYSYAHLPLLMGLAAMSAGMRLLIEHAGDDHLGTGASVALIGGVVLFLISLIGTRTVAVGGPHRLGVTLKLGTVAVLLGLLAAEAVLPPVAVGGALAAVLAGLVFAERELIPPSEPL